MNRTTIDLRVIQDTCLGYTVFRGSAPAKEIVEAAWIDFHDPIRNPLGYQRAFDEERSEKARIYAEEGSKPFWPESILAVRNDEGLEEEEKVKWSFKPDSGYNGRFGTLSATYTKGLTTNINGVRVPWRRALSQVDCQHRLGRMSDSDKPITFCILVDMNRREEAIVFKSINQNQRGIPTSLVDIIILRTDDNTPAQISLAWGLSVDPGSPFCNLVDTGGRGQENTLIKFRGLQQSLKLLIPPKYLSGKEIDYDQGYEFARNFWNVVKDEWPIAFSNKSDYKMMVNPGVRALSRLGRRVLESNLDVQDFTRMPIERYLQKGKHLVEWSIEGPLKDATGKGAEKRVLEQLDEWFGEPT